MKIPFEFTLSASLLYERVKIFNRANQPNKAKYSFVREYGIKFKSRKIINNTIGSDNKVKILLHFLWHFFSLLGIVP